MKIIEPGKKLGHIFFPAGIANANSKRMIMITR